ncbi:hypothetical protein DDQ41_00035 [Streptomyces spongiicola]|uniref:Uncharacterized protein n=1 Tax=Streptomyces spongiicola TaxID=1690221 RepID=A0ABM6V0G2_9ACTN|nr:hypothetical protein DDQ41_00035 [Streptomyces spongiicola]
MSESTSPFEDQAQWEHWLEENHESAAGVWVKIAKKDSGIPSVTYVRPAHGPGDGRRPCTAQRVLHRLSGRRPGHRRLPAGVRRRGAGRRPDAGEHSGAARQRRGGPAHPPVVRAGTGTGPQPESVPVPPRSPRCCPPAAQARDKAAESLRDGPADRQGVTNRRPQVHGAGAARYPRRCPRRQRRPHADPAVRTPPRPGRPGAATGPARASHGNRRLTGIRTRTCSPATAPACPRGPARPTTLLLAGGRPGRPSLV